MDRKKSLIICIFICILLIGCSKQIEPECKNITITNTVGTIKYINNTITEKCNITNNTIKYVYTGTTSRELELIRRIGFLERQQDKWIINETECMPHNKTEEDLEKCYTKLNYCEDDVDDLEDEINDCEDLLCEYNESWC